MSARTKGRLRQVQRLLDDVADWAGLGDVVAAVALVGSYARGTAGMASHVDLVIVSPRFDELAQDLTWFARLRPGSKLIRAESWGPLLERRFRLRTGLHVELGLVSSAWVELPLDPGTRRVLVDGHTVLYDRSGMLSRAAEVLAISSQCPSGPCQ